MAFTILLLYCLIIISSPIDTGQAGSLQLSLGFSALSPPEVVVQRNHPFLLNCSGFSKEGRLHISWKQQGVSVQDKHFQILSNGSLYSERGMRKKDEGNYTCLLKNRVGVLISRPIHLQFARMSKSFTIEPQPLSVFEGGQARFSCQIFAVPPAGVLWLKDGMLLPQNSTKLTFLPSGVLQIFKVTLSDGGEYSCRCKNEVRQKESITASLTVLSRTESFQQPVFLSPSDEVLALKNTPTVLECLADGFPEVHIQWTKKDGLELPEHLQRSGNLYFPKVQPNHSGSYVCSAKVVDSHQAVTITHTVSLVVLAPPRFTKVPLSQSIPSAQTARFECNVEVGAAISWLKDGKEVAINGRIKLKSGRTLVISQTVVSDSGIYQCVASNTVGVATVAARLLVNASSDQPQAPTGLKAFTLSSSSILLSWDIVISHPSAPIQAYTVHYLPTDGGLEQDAVSANTSLILERLHPFTNYTFYVRAYSNKSAGEPSIPIIQKTGEDVPLIAPKVTLTTVSPTTLHVQWDELLVDDARGVIVDHRIYYRKHEQASSTVLSSNESSGYTITGLTPNLKYDVRVLSGTKAGFPTLSDDAWPWTVHEMPPLASAKVPSPPVLHLTVFNDTALDVHWSMPADDPFPATGFYLSFRQSDQPLQKRIALPADASQFLLHALAPQSWYEVHLVAFNKKGESIESVRKIITSSGDNIQAETVEVVEPPQHVEAEPNSWSEIQLTWHPPDTNHNISYYTVRYYPALNQTAVNYVRSTNNEVVILDLQPYTLYEFAVRSHDIDNRQGPYSLTVQCRTKEAIPSSPKELSWTPLDAHSIRLNWQPPDTPNGVITAYAILYSNTNSDELDLWNYKEGKGSDLTLMLDGLSSNTLYYVCLRAKNSAGLSPSTQPLPFNIPVRSNNTHSPSQETYNRQSSDHYLGAMIGGFIGLSCLIVCIIVISYRNRCCPRMVERPHVNGGNQESHEMPMITSFPNGAHLDTKGGYGVCNGRANGISTSIHCSSKSHQNEIKTSVRHLKCKFYRGLEEAPDVTTVLLEEGATQTSSCSTDPVPFST